MVKKRKTTKRGRPPRETATSHEAILSAVYDLLQEKSVRDLTIEEVARQAGVGKPTIYKWWPSKAALVMAMLDDRSTDDLSALGSASAEDVIRHLLADVVRRFNGFLGKVAIEILAEGQSDPDVLQEYRERYLNQRRAFATGAIERAQAAGELRRDIDPQVLLDMIFGPIYFRRFVRHEKLDQRFADEVFHHVMAYARSQPRRTAR
jgi:AcrR family transcriptional regulator